MTIVYKVNSLLERIIEWDRKRIKKSKKNYNKKYNYYGYEFLDNERWKSFDINIFRNY